MQPSNVRAAMAAAPISTTLLVLNVVVFIAVNLDASLLDLVSLPPSWEGVAAQPWTLFTAVFASEALVHIGVAVLVIGLFGPRLERHVGSAHVLGVYLLAGLAGSLALVATAAATGFEDPSVGASAAFLGLLGALATSPRRARGNKLPLDKIILIVVVTQLAAPVMGVGDWVSSAAHIAGLALGAAYGYLLRPRTASEHPATPASSH